MRLGSILSRRFRGSLARGLLHAAMLILAVAPLAEAQQPIPVNSGWTKDDDRRLEALLQKPISAQYVEVPLSKVADDLHRQTGVQFHLDLRALVDASIAPDTPVTCKFWPVPLEQALKLILTPLDLTWTVLDGHLAITTFDKANNILIVKIYPVQDLANRVGGISGHDYQTRFENLRWTIENTVAATTWDQVGGPGGIAEFTPSRSLVIAQTVEVHRQIDELLAALREARDVQAGPRHQRKPFTRSVVSDPEAEAASRYVVTPTTDWSVPRVHQ